MDGGFKSDGIWLMLKLSYSERGIWSKSVWKTDPLKMILIYFTKRHLKIQSLDKNADQKKKKNSGSRSQEGRIKKLLWGKSIVW